MIIIPLGIRDSVKKALEIGDRVQYESKEDTEQQSKIIEEIERALKAGEDIMTDFVQENVETEHYMFMFRLFTVRERGFALTEDYQKGSYLESHIRGILQKNIELIYISSY